MGIDLFLLLFILLALIFVYLVVIGKLSIKPFSILLVIIASAILIPIALNAFIWLYVSSSPETVIPNVMGMSKEEAINLLQKNNLKGEVIGVAFSNSPSGTVVSQRPEAGKRVKEGRVISLILSISENTVKVPDLLGKATDEAYYLIKNSGLVPGKISYVYSDNGQGLIIEQNPSPGTSVQKGTEVSVKVLTKQNDGEETDEQND